VVDKDKTQNRSNFVSIERGGSGGSVRSRIKGIGQELSEMGDLDMEMEMIFFSQQI